MKRLLLTAILGIAMSTPTKTSELASLSHATEWINSPPLTEKGLQGKVVLVQFWTYSCINWLRTMPYVRAWAEKYRDKGLVVIGVHSPEFGFEKQLPNVRWGAKNYRVDYPIAMDNDFAIWRGLRQPVLAGAVPLRWQGQRPAPSVRRGWLRGDRAGHPETPDRGGGQRGREGPGVGRARWCRGAGRLGRRQVAGDLRGYRPGQRTGCRRRAKLRLNQWALGGDWTVQGQPAVLNKADGRITYRFHARDLNLVMAPGAAGKPVRFRVLIDGQPPGAAHGIDVDEQGNGAVAEPRMYQLIRQQGSIADRQFEIQFLDPGVEVFVFTFG